jgi:hypothetical protein
MERKYLVAALAMIATFAGVSRGFQSLQQLSLLGQHGQTLSVPLPSIVGRVLAKLNNGLHQTDPEEAQLLAEMNLPIAALQAKAAEQAAKQSQIAAELARADEMARQQNAAPAVSIELPALAGLDHSIQVRTAVMAQRLAARSAKIQIAAAKWQAASLQVENSAKRHSPCNMRPAEMR